MGCEGNMEPYKLECFIKMYKLFVFILIVILAAEDKRLLSLCTIIVIVTLIVFIVMSVIGASVV